MGIVVFIRIVYGRFGGHHLGDHRSFAYRIFSQDELQPSLELWNNTFIFTLLGFLYLLGGSIWVNAVPDTLLKSNQRSLR